MKFFLIISLTSVTILFAVLLLNFSTYNSSNIKKNKSVINSNENKN